MPLVTRQSNQGNLYKQDDEPGDWQNGDLWSDTDDNGLFLNVGGTATALVAGIFGTGSGGATYSINASRFRPISSSGVDGPTEALTDIQIDFAFTVTSLSFTVEANSKNANSTAHFRDDGADVGSLTITAATTGGFRTAISTAVAANSLCNFEIDTSASASGSLINFSLIANYTVP